VARINVDVPEEVKERLDAQAKLEQRTLRAVVLRAVEAYLEEHGENKEVAR